MIPINDDRLTPTMERMRNGSTQLFRERNKENRASLNSETAEVSLTHDNKAMYAELVDGKWFWINGCAECNGKERDWMTYIECEEHDRCRVCKTKRKDIEGIPWGGKKGWTCESCDKIKRDERRRLAFEKLDGQEPDCTYTDDVICPHCGSELCKDDMYESQDIECYVCEGKIQLEVDYTFTYSTRVKGDRVTK